MKKEEFTRRYGEEGYEKQKGMSQQRLKEWRRTHPEENRERSQGWYREHQEEAKEHAQLWKLNNPEKERETQRLWRLNNSSKVKARNQEIGRKGGKYYEKTRKYKSTGIPHERELVRAKHTHRYRPYKQIIAPDSVLHHQWQVGTANYDGVALVEKQQHQHGYIDVIQILEGEITLLTEAEVRKGGCEI